MNFPSRATPRVLRAVYFGVSLVAVLYIPYFFPVSPSTSESYIFGYNNRGGVLLLLLLTSIGAICVKGPNFDFSPIGPSPKIPLRFLGLSLAVEFAACAGMYMCAGRFGAFGEPEQQVNRIWLLSQGKKPYIDFEWPWGPSLLYVPKWLSELLHLNIPQGYFLFWVITSLIGIVLLFATLNLIDFPGRHKTAIFLLFSTYALFSVLNMGSNYTLVRYICPLFCILIVNRVNQRSPQLRTKIHAAILAVAFTATLLLISPEVTIAHAFACIVLLYPGRPTLAHRSQIFAYLAALTALAVLFSFALKVHILDSIKLDGQGANSFPIAFSPAILFFFTVVFICACYLVRRASDEGIQDNTIALIAFSIPMTAAALGRCDPGHVLLNGIGFFIAVFFYASTSPRMWKLYRNGFVACFLVITPFWGVFASLRSFTKYARPAFPGNSDILSLYPDGEHPARDQILLAPFGYVPDAKGFYFSPRIDYGFYDGLFDANTPEATRRKISELAQRPQARLLLWKNFEAACEVHERSERLFISILFAFPYTASAEHRESIRKPLCDYIFAHYTLAAPATPGNFQYEMWKPTP